MASISIQPTGYPPLSYAGLLAGKQGAQNRPDIKTIQFEQGPSLGDRKQSLPFAKPTLLRETEKNGAQDSLVNKNPERGPDGTKSASPLLTENENREQRLVYDHDDKQLVWQTYDSFGAVDRSVPKKTSLSALSGGGQPSKEKSPRSVPSLRDSDPSFPQKVTLAYSKIQEANRDASDKPANAALLHLAIVDTGSSKPHGLVEPISRV